jgi:hypothetical protein
MRMTCHHRRWPARRRALVAAGVCALSLGALPSGRLRAQDPATACLNVSADPGRGVAAPLHPTSLETQYAAVLAARDWERALRGYMDTIRFTIAVTDAPSAAPSVAYTRVANAYRESLEGLVAEVTLAVRAPRHELASRLERAEINAIRPDLEGGRVFLLQRSTGEAIPASVDSMRDDERNVLCWSAWSLYRLFHAINFESVPAAFARVEATSRRWRRYQDQGPLQLPHELLLNRLARPVLGGLGSSRYDPPRVSLAVLHPFAGVELRRTGDAWVNRQSAAVQLAGASLWIGDWRTPVGASWIAAVGANGVVGLGALVRVGDFANIGYIDRPVPDGPRERSAIFQLDALRLFTSDARAKQLLAALGISGRIFEQTQDAGRP